MPMTQCYVCGNRYNKDVTGQCPICEYREKPITTPTESDLVAQASDPSTDAGTLGKLALSSNPKVVAAAMSNPSTPEWAKGRAQDTLASAAFPAPTQPLQASGATAMDSSILRELRDIRDASRSTRNFLFILLFVYPPILLLVGLLVLAQ